MTKTSTSNNYEQEEDRILSVASPTTEEGTLLSKVSIEIHQVSSNPNKDHHGINPTGDEPREEEKTERDKMGRKGKKGEKGGGHFPQKNVSSAVVFVFYFIK